MDNCKIAIFIGLLIALIIVKFIKSLSFLDPVVINNPRLTVWSFTHFITFYILGKLCPNHYFGILWEIFEKVYGKLTDDVLYWTSNGITGQTYDVIMNMLGYHLAHII